MLERIRDEAEALVEREARAVIDAPWPDAGRRPARACSPASRRAYADRGARSGRPRGDRLPIRRCRRSSRTRRAIAQGQHVSRSGDAGRRRRAARRSARVRLRRGRRRQLRQRVPAAAAAAEGVRRADPQLAARRRGGDRRVRRRRARRPAADRRDAVQRLRRDRLQPAGEQRREDPLPLGRRGADGAAHAVGRPAARRAVPQPEHRGVVLPHAGPEDRRPVDAGRRARADGGGGGRSGSGALLRAHRALPRSAHQAAARPPSRRRRCRSAAPRCGARETISRSSPTAPTCTRRCRSPSGSRRTASSAAVLDLRMARAARQGTPCSRSRGTAAAC